jgi:type IV pilus assembly protein PilC
MILSATVLGFALCLYLAYKWPFLALILAPVLSVLTFFGASLDEDMVAACLAPGIFLTTYTLLAFCIKDRDDCHTAICVARWLLFVPLFVGIFVLISVVLDPWALVVLFVFGVWMASMISYGATSRWSKSVCVFSTMAASVHQNLPLPMALDAAAHGRNDGTGRTLRQIKKWLLQGCSVTDALIKGYPQCPRHAWRLLKAAEQVDQLDQGFASVLHNIKAQQKQKETLSPVHPVYPVTVFISVMVVSLGLLKFVIPSFKEILYEMAGIDLPYITRVFIYIYSEWGDLLFYLILGGMILFLLTRMLRWLRPEAYKKDGIVSWVHDWIKWHLPILHWFEQNYALSQLVGTLRFSCQAGCPVDQAIANCLGLDMNNCFKSRVNAWLNRVESGQDIAQAARASGLSSTLAWAFDPKVNSGNAFNVLTMLETFYRSNYSYCVNLARIILTPTITIGLAVFVGFVVIAMFLPAVSVITAMIDIYP